MNHERIITYLDEECLFLLPSIDASVDPTDIDDMIKALGSVEKTLEFLRSLDNSGRKLKTFEEALWLVHEEADKKHDKKYESIDNVQEEEETHSYIPPLAVTSNIDTNSAYLLFQQLKQRSNLYSDMSDNDIKTLSRLSSCIKFEAGDKIIQKNEQSTFVLFVLDGSLGLKCSSDDAAMPLSKGVIYGASGYFMNSQIRQGDIIAAKPSIIAVIGYQLIHRLVDIDSSKASFQAKLIHMLAVCALKEQNNTPEENITPPQMDEGMPNIRKLLTNEFLFRQIALLPNNNISLPSDDDMLNDITTSMNAEKLDKENKELNMKLSHSVESLSQLESQVKSLTDHVNHLEETNRIQKDAISSFKLDPVPIFETDTIPDDGSIDDKIKLLPNDIKDYIQSLEEKHLKASDAFRHMRVEQQETQAQLSHWCNEYDTLYKNSQEAEKASIHSEERQKQEISGLLKNVQSYALLLKFISVQQFVKNYKIKNELKHLYSKLATLTSNSMLEVVLSKNNNIIDQDNIIHELKTRTKRKLKDYPWKKIHSIPMKWLLSHLEQEVGELQTSMNEMSSERQRWQETSQSFFDRNLELKNECLNNDANHKEDRDELKRIRAEYEKLEEENKQLLYQVENADIEVAKAQNHVSEEQNRAAVQVRSVRIEKSILFAESIDLRRRISKLKQYLDSLVNLKSNLESQIEQLSFTKNTLVKEKREATEIHRKTRQTANSNVLFAYGIASAVSSTSSRKNSQDSSSSNAVPEYDKSMTKSSNGGAKRIKMRKPPPGVNKPSSSGKWRSTSRRNNKDNSNNNRKSNRKHHHHHHEQIIDITLPPVQPLFRTVEYTEEEETTSTYDN